MAPRLKAFTEIYCGLASDSYHLWGIWGSLPAEKIRLVDREDNGLSVWIANQFINWEHYEETDEFIPCWQNVKRSQGMKEFLGKGDQVGKWDTTIKPFEDDFHNAHPNYLE